jgi:hypothetical protein
LLLLIIFDGKRRYALYVSDDGLLKCIDFWTLFMFIILFEMTFPRVDTVFLVRQKPYTAGR